MEWIKAKDTAPKDNGSYFVRNAVVWGMWEYFDGGWYYDSKEFFITGLCPKLEWLNDNNIKS